MSSLGDVLFELDDLLRAGGIRYAIGGALALAFYAEPRATTDIDLCVSTPQGASAELRADLAGAGWLPDGNEAMPIAGTRFRRTGDQICFDIFFSFDPYHDALLAHAVTFPFVSGDRRRTLPFVSADDYVVLKLSFSRPKDWVDVQAVIEAGTPLDVEYITRALVGFRGPTFHRHIGRLLGMIKVVG